MNLIHVIAIIVFIGILLWVVNTYVTIMDANVKKILNIAVIVGLVIWLFLLFFGPLPNVRIGQ